METLFKIILKWYLLVHSFSQGQESFQRLHHGRYHEGLNAEQTSGSSCLQLNQKQRRFEKCENASLLTELFWFGNVVVPQYP
jgi:hypothetical protein